MAQFLNLHFKRIVGDRLLSAILPYLRSAAMATVAVYSLGDSADAKLVTVVLIEQSETSNEKRCTAEPIANSYPSWMSELIDTFAGSEILEDQGVAAQNLPLSPREAEVLLLMQEGASNKAIARKLNIAVGTVKIHVRRILAKTSCSNRTQAALWRRTRNL